MINEMCAGCQIIESLKRIIRAKDQIIREKSEKLKDKNEIIKNLIPPEPMRIKVFLN